MRLATFSVILALIAASPPGNATEPFEHALHIDVAEDCTECHAGAVRMGAPLLPSAEVCAACHDEPILGQRGATPSNLRFDHSTHAEAADCADCHGSVTAREPVRPVISSCADCHEVDDAHPTAGGDCAACHVPLWESSLPEARIAAFPAPRSHAAEEFALGGHGAALDGSAGGTAGCAVCHARDFCSQCHVDGPDREAIRVLEPDSRSLALAAELTAPTGHADAAFLESHGHDDFEPTSCATCHTRESCWVCHAATPFVADGLPRAGPERGAGAQPDRHRPDSHDATFRSLHGPAATAAPQNCAACHDRAECLDCHRPEPTSASPGYHPAGYLARHPVDAYARETSCADCHHAREFCASCHQQSGLTDERGGRIGAGYHDRQPNFLLGHGEAARRHLESCVSCHAENDCLACHSSRNGRGFNPHGPDFPASRLREKAPQMCTVCHGLSIPGG